MAFRRPHLYHLLPLAIAYTHFLFHSRRHRRQMNVCCPSVCVQTLRPKRPPTENFDWLKNELWLLLFTRDVSSSHMVFIHYVYEDCHWGSRECSSVWTLEFDHIVRDVHHTVRIRHDIRRHKNKIMHIVSPAQMTADCGRRTPHVHMRANRGYRSILSHSSVLSAQCII